MKIDIGIKDTDRERLAKGLGHLLADSYTLYLKTHNFHWNVTGPMFLTLHQMFEEQYTELHAAVDLIAERIRALGHFAPGSPSIAYPHRGHRPRSIIAARRPGPTTDGTHRSDHTNSTSAAPLSVLNRCPPHSTPPIRTVPCASAAASGPTRSG